MTLPAVTGWRYPITIKNIDNYNEALMSALTGFYPIGVNKLIHQGVHFDENALNKLGVEKPREINSKVYCIADGEVIAYRVNDNYQKLDYGDRVGFFSTGFVLVRHLLEMERVEEETNSTKTEKQKQPPHRLYFYSLYMHLADKAFYEKNSKQPVPAFWQQDIYQVKDKNLQYIKGLNCRNEPDPQNNLNKLAVLQTGTKLKLNLDINREGKSHKMWYAVSSLVEGYSTIPQLEPIQYQHGTKTVDILGWVNTGDKVDDPIFEVKESGDTLFVKSKGLPVKDENGKIISMLPIGTDIKISGNTQNGSLVELIEIIGNGKPTIPLPEGKNKVLFDGLKKHVRPQKYNEVVVLDKPFPIKAGDLIGHVGHNQSYETAITKKIDKDTEKPIDIDLLPLTRPLKETEFRPNFHLECFTCDDLPNFIAQTQAEASKIADKDKTLLAISEQAKLLVAAKKADTNVGKPYKDTKLKILSKRRNIKWLQIEITTSETEKKTLWIENNKNIMSKSEISLDEKTEAWTSHPLQVSDLSSSTSSVAMPVLLKLNDKKFQSRDNQAEDEQGISWFRIDKLEKGVLPIKGWVAIDNQNVKKYSSWDWFNFKQIKEAAPLKEIYLDIKKSSARDNAALESYKPILKETLTILDKQFHPDQKKYAKIDTKSFSGLADKPHLSSALSRLLIHYESEWYSEINAEGKMPKWEALNSEMNECNKKLLDYLQTGDETKLNAYLDKIGKSTDLSEANKHKKDRETISTFPADYKDNPKEKLNDNQKKSYENLTALENDVMVWEQEKEKIKKLLWWSDVVKSQAKLNPDGKVWSIHPMAMLEIVISNDLIDVENFIAMYKLEHHKLIKASKDPKTNKVIITKPKYDQESIEILRGILKRINLFFRKNAEYPPNLYYLSYMLATGHWETTYAKEFDSLVERNNGRDYDPVLASTEILKERAKANGNTEEGDGSKYRGRGLAQMTWKPNYKKASEYLNVDFVNQPERAAELDYAVPILIWGSINGTFSGNKLPKYINEEKIDYKLARYVINGQNYAQYIAQNAECFEAILRQTSNLIEVF